MRIVPVIDEVGLRGVSHSAFGELSVVEPTVQTNMQWPYNINSRITESRANQSGTVDQNNGMLRLQTGAAANSSGTGLSVSPVSYRPGQGIVVRCTGVFTTGVANSSQYIGIGDAGDGLFFGYNGADFGIMQRANGIPEIRTLTVTVAVDATKSLIILARRNATLTGASFADVDSNTSSMRADTAATAQTGGTIIDRIAVQKQGAGEMQIGEILPGDFVTFSGVAPSGTGHEAAVGAGWVEGF